VTRHRWVGLLLFLLLAAVWGNGVLAQGAARVYVIPVVGTIDEGLAAFVERSVALAREERADAILLEVNTFGGRVDSATAIRDSLLAAGRPVLAFVRERAWSAGALITLAADKIAMAPGASIGAAEPQPAEEKTISALRAEFEATAQRHGRDPKVAAAMVDKRIAIEGLVAEGEILTLTAARAGELGFVDLVAESRQDVLAAFGLSGAVVAELSPNWAERIARFFTDPTVSSLLLTLGFLGLLAEVTSPGWGVPGTAGLTALALFFGARLIAGLAGLEIVLLFLLGIGLLLLEALVLPGFGVAGVGGLAAIFASLYLSFPDASSAFTVIGLATLATVVFGAFLIRRVPKTGIWRRIALETRLEELGVPGDDPQDPVVHVGAQGQALTPLRPAGTVEIGGLRVDAVSEGEFLPAGTPVKVTKVIGGRVTVRQAKEG